GRRAGIRSVRGLRDRIQAQVGSVLPARDPRNWNIPAGHGAAHELLEVLAHTASRLASHFLSICIRAIDYCPPVDLEFGEYLRALITADYNLVPDDPWAYREALIEAFARRRIFARNVETMSEDALLWRPPPKPG